MNIIDRYKSLSYNARLWLWDFAFWTFFGIANFVFFSVRFGWRISWYADFALQMFFWYSLALSIPVIFFLWRKFPVATPHRIGRFLLHVLFSGIFVIVFLFFRIFYDSIHPARPMGTTSGSPLVARLYTVSNSASVIFFDYWAFLGAAVAIDNYRKYREREKEAAELQIRASQLEARLAVARLQALRMQLNPHFLFNTLHSISALVREDNKPAAIRMIAGLGDLLRQTLENSASNEVTLKEELDFLEKYLEIEQQRFQDRLQVRMQVEQGTVLANVPYLILQPLVENAVRHGISKSSTASLIEIRTHLHNGNLVLEVRDDGPGVITPCSENVGLTNTRNRLAGMYKDKFEFELKNRAEGGAVATITIPFIPHGAVARKS